MTREFGSEPPKIGIQAAASVTAAFLSGAMMSLSAFVVPVLLDTDTESTHLVRQWARLYHYGHIYLPALSVGTTGLYGYIALRPDPSEQKHWLTYAAAGATTITMVPFTWLVMVPTNNALFRLEALAAETASDVDLNTVRGLVVRWAWLHVVRSLFPLVGAILGFAGVLGELGL